MEKNIGFKFLFGIISLFCTIAGLVFFLVWRKTKPTLSKVCGICALVNVAIGVLILVIYFAVGAALCDFNSDSKYKAKEVSTKSKCCLKEKSCIIDKKDDSKKDKKGKHKKDKDKKDKDKD